MLVYYVLNKIIKFQIINIIIQKMLFKNLVDIPGRICLHEGDLLELDPIENTPIQRIHCYLFSDTCVVASWLSSR